MRENLIGRIAYIDYIKFIGICLMVMGHIIFFRPFNLFISAFHMPLFFFASGLLYHKRQNLKMVIAKKTKTLLLPYCLVGIFHYIIWLLFHWNEEMKYLPLLHLFTYNNSDLPYAGALWFLTAFWFSQVIYCGMDNIISKKWVLNLAVALLALLGVLGGYFKLPWSIDKGLVGVGFIHIGRIYIELTKKISNVSETESKSIVSFVHFHAELFHTLFFCLILMLIFINGSVNMRIGQYHWVLLFWINATGMCISILWFSKKIHSFISKTWKLLDAYICSVGRNSIIYLCFNQIIIKALQQLFFPIKELSVYNFQLMGKALYYLLVFVFTMYILWWIGRLKDFFSGFLCTERK